MCADVKAKHFFTVNLPRGQKKHLRGLDLTATYDIIEYNRKSKNSEVRQPHRAYGKRRLLMENITVGKNDAGQRLDKFLTKHCKGIPLPHTFAAYCRNFSLSPHTVGTFLLISPPGML